MGTQRPVGITALALILWFLASAAVLGTFATGDHGPAFTVAFVAYAASAAVAGYGLWKQRKWAAVAFGVWGVMVLVSQIMFDLTFNFGPTIRGVAFVVGTAVFLALGYWYVRKNTSVGA